MLAYAVCTLKSQLLKQAVSHMDTMCWTVGHHVVAVNVFDVLIRTQQTAPHIMRLSPQNSKHKHRHTHIYEDNCADILIRIKRPG